MRKIAMLVLLGAAACGPGGNAYPAGAVSPLVLQPPPIYSLFGYRDAVGLTSEQVETLDSIAQAVRRLNEPVADSLRAIAESRRGRSRGIIPLDDSTRPLLERVQQNNREATRAVEGVLTVAQQEEVCRLVEQTRRSRERGRDESDRERRQMAAADSLFLPRRGSWPWCEPATVDG